MAKGRHWFERLEETLIAFLLGIMTLVTFANVIARYVFNSNIFYALELTVFMFGWLVLLGASYAVKKNAHLGVDAIINMANPPMRRRMALFVACACILYSVFLLKGAWDYWAPYANLAPTSGRWFPTGLSDSFRGQGWYETQDIPIPFFLIWLKDVFNDGASYEKLPKVVPYLVLPLSMALLLYRFCQAGWAVWQGKLNMLIVSHEATEGVEDTAVQSSDQDEVSR